MSSMKHFLIVFSTFLCLLLICGCAQLPGEKYVINGTTYFDMAHHTKQIDLKEYGQNFAAAFYYTPDYRSRNRMIPLIRLMKHGESEPVVLLQVQDNRFNLRSLRASSTSVNPAPMKKLHIALTVSNGKITLWFDRVKRCVNTVKKKSDGPLWDFMVFGGGLPEQQPCKLPVCDFQFFADPEKALELPPEKSPAKFEKQKKKYEALGITVSHYVPKPKVHTGVTGEKLDEKTMRRCAAVLYDALDLLPAEFIRNSGLKNVHFLKGLKSYRVSCNGCAVGDTIWFDVTAKDKTMYHELFHIIAKKCRELWDIPTNPPGFDYRHQHRKDKKQRTTEPPPFRKHFVSNYAMTSGGEDRSETFAFMMMEGPQFFYRAQESPWLMKKMDAVIRICMEKGGMDETFWSRFLEDDSFIAREAERKAAQLKKYADMGVTVSAGAYRNEELQITASAPGDDVPFSRRRERLLDILDRLPAPFVKASQIRTVQLVDDLKQNEKVLKSLMTPDNVLLINVAALEPQNIYRAVYRQFDLRHVDGADWQQTNPPGCPYFGVTTPEIRRELARKYKDFHKWMLHFAGYSAIINDREDRIETFACLWQIDFLFHSRYYNSEYFRKKAQMIMKYTEKFIDRNIWSAHLDLEEINKKIKHKTTGK